MSTPPARPGQTLGVLERTLAPWVLVAYAGATWDWHPLHHDREAALAAGLPGVVVDGQLLGALLAEQVMDWAGPRARLRSLSFRFGDLVLAGDTVRVSGRVVDVEPTDEGRHVTLAQRVEAAGRTAIDGAHAGVLLPPAG